MIDEPTIKIFGIPLGAGILALLGQRLLVGVFRGRRDIAGDNSVVAHMERQAKRIQELEAMLEITAKERNDAVSKVGGLETQVFHLATRVEELTVLVETFRNEQKDRDRLRRAQKEQP